MNDSRILKYEDVRVGDGLHNSLPGVSYQYSHVIVIGIEPPNAITLRVVATGAMQIISREEFDSRNYLGISDRIIRMNNYNPAEDVAMAQQIKREDTKDPFYRKMKKMCPTCLGEGSTGDGGLNAFTCDDCGGTGMVAV